MGAGQAVVCARIDLQHRVLDDLRGEKRDLVVVAVNDQRWHVKLLEIFNENHRR